MIRVVLDTNILISATLTPKGLPAQVLLLCLTDPEVRLCMSAVIFAEYEEVMRRPKFKRSEPEITDILQVIRQNSRWFRPAVVVRDCVDSDDNVFLECSQAANAHFLVTGNIKHFPERWERTRILTAHQFLQTLAGEG